MLPKCWSLEQEILAVRSIVLIDPLLIDAQKMSLETILDSDVRSECAGAVSASILPIKLWSAEIVVTQRQQSSKTDTVFWG